MNPTQSPVIANITELRSLLLKERCKGNSVGLVPTMGCLHKGHLSLIQRCSVENDLTVVSVFVNPLQFGENEDFATYPRDLDRDQKLAAEAGANIVFAPTTAEMYPQTPATTVVVAPLNTLLEGKNRPGHFEGVATVVTKLFAIFGSGQAYFGEKDYQQLLLIRRLVTDLSLPIKVVGCPTLREPDGLAMSSRNTYLSPPQRTAATVLWRSLQAGQKAVQAGSRDPREVTAAMAAVLATEPAVATDYATVVDASTLKQPTVLAGDLRLLVAARVGGTRLIDNIGVRCEQL